MFYRRKIVLSVLQAFGSLENIRLQHLLFLFAEAQTQKVYDFIPYKYGCFSPSANADLLAMAEQSLIKLDDNTVAATSDLDYCAELKKSDIQILENLLLNFFDYNTEALLHHTYTNYPYWATKSSIKKQLCSAKEIAIIERQIHKRSDTVLFTIGYEGISFEAYINKLLKNDIQMLVDVRHNPMSMKYGFSRKTLSKICEGVGILYKHIPELGIQSSLRKSLFAQNDYDNLFLWYRGQHLSQTVEQQQETLRLLQTHKRIALTCFEADICQCHRKPLAEAIALLPDFNYTVEHL